jgi:hypothetical protein
LKPHEAEVCEYALKRYVFEHEYRKVERLKDLEDYVKDLNREKYARP